MKDLLSPGSLVTVAGGVLTVIGLGGLRHRRRQPQPADDLSTAFRFCSGGWP